MTALAATAERLDQAIRTATATHQMPEAEQFDAATGYAVQAMGIELRRRRGERVIGVKMGLTSRAKMAQVGVDEVTWGRLTDAMRREEGGSLVRADFIHPRAEPEIAFILKRRLTGTVSLVEAALAIEAVAPAIEIIDSRYENFRFSLGDVVADNSSSAAFFLGPYARPDLDVANLGIVLSIDGRPREIGSSAAILGHPLRALVAAAEMTARAGHVLEAGDIVLAGAATAAVPLEAGMQVEAEMQSLGRVGFSVV
ncbi:fumarylacetoacetate hydrolase family protein [Aquamicrobium sp. NLF2-7]|uniref:2-keto-4-pentenoate hydratase n=1 Tax=Aquamicrobium sp. NLF2-7 TaxID=2918753 RepID=UPI001EFA8228|nr:fumarylacetoacetate hydrolase family protein [Aquamicrobium sp. NLF2-7]MCG8274108.1 fumarylacetoacetate hydrolase family protein [Aquamicrobium sp. NLF2-7]